ncbi:hypothetical protein [uncultured Acidaminococcus sp.]|uniref:MuF-C-terminal domain-containing protein n=1 Tax=uncultured Acidaminococcus sp. TaxID=352152 RepID=UPI002943F06A|nr:hypothetical protein [uncultured Acidaminococcus sp.]
MVWGNELDNISQRKNEESIRVMDTPLVLTYIGADHLPLKMRASKIKKILAEHKEMDVNVLKRLPRAIASPLAIFPSETESGKYLMVLDLAAPNKGNVVLPIELNGSDGTNYEVNVALSAYTKSDEKTLVPKTEWYTNHFENKTGKNITPLYLNEKKLLAGITRTGSNCLILYTTQATSLRIVYQTKLI